MGGSMGRQMPLVRILIGQFRHHAGDDLSDGFKESAHSSSARHVRT
jgi:hypothetical protein